MPNLIPATAPLSTFVVSPVGYAVTTTGPVRTKETYTYALVHTLTLPYPPPLNNIYATVNGRRVLSARGKQFKADAVRLALVAGIKTPLTGKVAVTIDIYRPRKSGDLDNFLKIVQDSLKGIAWVDDSQIVEIHAHRHDDAKNPRAEVQIGSVWREEDQPAVPQKRARRTSTKGAPTR